MITLHVPDMSCGHCRATVEKAITGVDAGARVSVDLTSRRVEVSGSADAGKLADALRDAGYESTPVR